jgi:hypothetical protein
MLVGRVVVGDEMQIEIGRGVAVDFSQEPNEFLMTVTLHALANDRSIQHLQSREQGGCPVGGVAISVEIA